MNEGTTPNVDASSFSHSSLVDTKKSSSGNFSLKSVVATAKTTSEVQRREQEKVNEEEQGIMRLANECLEQRERRGSYQQNQEFPIRPNHRVTKVKKTPHEWRPPEPEEHGRRIIHGNSHAWNKFRGGWDRDIPHEWRHPARDENFKRIIHGRPHIWNKKKRRWMDDTAPRKVGKRRGSLSSTIESRHNSSRKRPKGSSIGKELLDDEFAVHSRSIDTKKSVSFPYRHLEVVDDSRGGIEELIDKVSNLQSKLDNLDEENTMWRQRYELLRKEYEEQMNMKYEAQKSSNNSLHSLQSKNAELEADLKEVEMQKNILSENNAKLTADLAAQTLMVDGQQKCFERVQHKNEELEGEIEDLESDNQVYSKRLETVLLELSTLKNSEAKESPHRKSLQENLEEDKIHLDQARLSAQTPSENDHAETIRMKEELESKSKENMDLQHNFNTMAMQNVKQSNTIEEQRQTIHRLRAQLDASKGNPLKIED